MKRRKILILLLFFSTVAGLFAGAVYLWLLRDLPSLDNLNQNLHTPSIQITDRNGRLLYEVIAEQAGRHTLVPLSAIPLDLQHATIATEDKGFYRNLGVDLGGILRALWINLHGGQTLAGGSTITQQVARNLLLDSTERGQRSLRRKLRETILAWQLTRQYSKDQILSLYLNQTYYGGMAYGVESAAQTFFAKPASQLDLAESALIAGLPQSPASYNPYTNPETAKKRQSVVLRLMQEQGYITSQQRELAKRERLQYAESPYPMRAPHFVMMVKAQVDALFTQEEIFQAGGLTIRTSLDLDWEELAEKAIQRQIEALKHSEDGLGHNLNNAALVALDPRNGEILALVGSPDYFDERYSGAINMALAPRQPGSALKPLVYAAALDPSQPQPWTAATMLLDVRTSFVTHDGSAYTPANYDRSEHGPVLLRTALASSLNIPAVITLDHIGLNRLFDLAERTGITTLGDPEQYDLSLALGGGEVKLLELTSAYAAFATGGYRVVPEAILEVYDAQGRLMYSPPKPTQMRVMDERVAWLIGDILSDNDARLLGFGPNSILRLDRPAAVKTGTTTNFHDNWTVGYTPDLVVGVWAGNTNYEGMRDVNGLSGAAPIWHQFLRTALTGKPPLNFSRPDGLQQFEVCALSGLLPTEACPYRRSEWFIDGTQPIQPDSIYQQVVLDTVSGKLADATTPPQQRKQFLALNLPVQAYSWAHDQGLLLLSDLLIPPSQITTGSSSAIKEMEIHLVSPPAKSVYRLSSSLQAGAQRIKIEAVCPAGMQQVALYVDGEIIGTFKGSPPYQAWWSLKQGSHQAWAEGIHADGDLITSPRISFEVLPSTP